MKKHNIFINIIFFIVSIFISLMFNSIETAYEIIKENNLLHSNNAFKIEISNSKISNNNIFKILNNSEDIYVEMENINLEKCYGKAIFFNNDLKDNPPMIKGRFLNGNDFNNKNRYCVIGKKLKNLIRLKNDKQYIKINGKEYLVIGIMGKDDRSSAFDEQFYINFNKYTPLINNSTWIIDGTKAKQNYKTLKKEIKQKDKNSIITCSNIDEMKSSISSIIHNRIYIIIMVVLVILTLLLNIVNCTNYYIINKKKEIGIRRAFGATKVQIHRKIICDYQLMAIQAFLISQIVYLLIMKLKFAPYIFGDRIMIKSSICSFLFLLLIGTIVASTPIIKSNKFQPNEIMKGM